MLENMKILVGFDGSNNSIRALKEAETIAKKFSGAIKIITVYQQGMEKKATEVLELAKINLDNSVKQETEMILGANPARALKNTASHEKFDLIVIGSRGLGSKASILVGSVSRQIVADAECNVLVVKK